MSMKDILQLIKTRLESKGFTVEITRTEIIGRLADGAVEERVKIKDVIRHNKGFRR